MYDLLEGKRGKINFFPQKNKQCFSMEMSFQFQIKHPAYRMHFFPQEISHYLSAYRIHFIQKNQKKANVSMRLNIQSHDNKLICCSTCQLSSLRTGKFRLKTSVKRKKWLKLASTGAIEVKGGEPSRTTASLSLLVPRFTFVLT